MASMAHMEENLRPSFNVTRCTVSGPLSYYYQSSRYLTLMVDDAFDELMDLVEIGDDDVVRLRIDLMK